VGLKPKACAKPENRAGILGNVRLVKGYSHASPAVENAPSTPYVTLAE
jgi:hypothetical protein